MCNFNSQAVSTMSHRHNRTHNPVFWWHSESNCSNITMFCLSIPRDRLIFIQHNFVQSALVSALRVQSHLNQLNKNHNHQSIARTAKKCCWLCTAVYCPVQMLVMYSHSHCDRSKCWNAAHRHRVDGHAASAGVCETVCSGCVLSQTQIK